MRMYYTVVIVYNVIKSTGEKCQISKSVFFCCFSVLED